MDMMSSPKDAAPAYEEAIQNHPVNQQLSASGSSRAYAAVPQIEIDESDHNNHGILHDEESHSHHDSAPLHPLSLDRTTPHFHCEVCDKLAERREKRRAESYCCMIVALVFMVAFLCATSVGIVIARAHAS